MEKFEFKNSSNIGSISYDSESKDLTISFRNSTKYIYRNIPQELYKKFTEAQSAGKFFYSNIRGHYSFRKLD